MSLQALLLILLVGFVIDARLCSAVWTAVRYMPHPHEARTNLLLLSSASSLSCMLMIPEFGEAPVNLATNAITGNLHFGLS